MASVGERWRRLRALSGAERWMLAQAVVGLPALALALRFIPLRAVIAALQGRGREPLAELQAGRARRAADVVGMAARHGIYAGNCLSRSVTLWWLLSRRRMRAELRIGVRREGADLLAHAWVEYDGRPLNESVQVCARYAAFDANIIPAAARWS